MNVLGMNWNFERNVVGGCITGEWSQDIICPLQALVQEAGGVPGESRMDMVLGPGSRQASRESGGQGGRVGRWALVLTLGAGGLRMELVLLLQACVGDSGSVTLDGILLGIAFLG